MKRFFTQRSVSPAMVLLIVAIVGSVAFVGGNRFDELLARVQGRPQTSSALDFRSLNDVYSVLRDKFHGELNEQELLNGAKRGLVAAAGDPYTSFFTDKEANEFTADLEGSFQGIGAELGKRNDQLVVISTLDESPAKKIGMLANDVIIQVNGNDTTGWSVEKAVSKIRGEKGTTVKITVLRGEQIKEFSITREAITNPSVKSEITADNIGILRIARFGDTDTVSLSMKAAESFRSAGVHGVVLDLRGNGGGYISTAQSIASLWLEDKVVVTERGTIGTETLRSNNSAPLKGIKTIVLVDGGSASASEIVAGALSDHGAATLVGQKTFGKGSAQTLQTLKSGGQLKVTVAKWYTPNGKNIDKEGIEPPVKVALSADDVNANRDPQKDKALELLR